MKASEVESRLKVLREAHGDLDVVHSGQCGGDYYDAECIEYDEDGNYFLVV